MNLLILIQKKLYKSIIKSHFNRPQLRCDNSWMNFHHPTFPNYLKTFNYKLNWNLLPTKIQYKLNYLDPKDACPFCKARAESNLHLFHYCKKLKPIFQYVNKKFFEITKSSIDIFKETGHIYMHNHPAITDPEQKDIYLYLIATTHHKIWKHRNEVTHGDSSFSPSQITNSIKNSIIGRARVERMRVDTSYLDFHCKIANAL